MSAVNVAILKFPRLNFDVTRDHAKSLSAELQGSTPREKPHAKMER